METTPHIAAKIQKVKDLLLLLNEREDLHSTRNSVLDSPPVQNFLKKLPSASPLIAKLSLREQIPLLSLIYLGEGPVLFLGFEELEHPLKKLKRLAANLKDIEKLYKPLGGLAGYILTALKLIQKKGEALPKQAYMNPPGLELIEEDPRIKSYIRSALEHFPEIGMVFPVGGAGDRLNLQDPETGEPLPQAKLIFNGQTLMEGLIDDVRACERIYKTLTGKSVIAPIALMTSREKSNSRHIENIFEENNWFNRPKHTFNFFEQPLVPVLTEEGDIAIRSCLELSLKPGGHGVLWELMKEKGVFDWFENLGSNYLLIRQINNPIAGLDMNLLGLAGQGIEQQKTFGFLSCPRRVNSQEGMNVLHTCVNEDGFISAITNIEYTEFHERGIEDRPESSYSPYSIFPANTNILFGEIKGIKKAIKKLPFPGLIMNMKTKIALRNDNGDMIEKTGGRLESTMQNIADRMTTVTKEPLNDCTYKKLKTFVLYNPRLKTISVAKREWKKGEPIHDTPPAAFIDKLKNNIELFRRLGFIFPPAEDNYPPNFLIDYNPSLGPLYSVIAQKIKGGEVSRGSELRLDMQDGRIENVSVHGSLIVKGSGFLKLKDVKVENKGIDWSAENSYWSGEIARKESIQIHLSKNSLFEAENIIFLGSQTFDVPEDHKMVVSQDAENVKITVIKLKKEVPSYTAQFTTDNSLLLTLKE